MSPEVSTLKWHDFITATRAYFKFNKSALVETHAAVVLQWWHCFKHSSLSPLHKHATQSGVFFYINHDLPLVYFSVAIYIYKSRAAESNIIDMLCCSLFNHESFASFAANVLPTHSIAQD